jgi:hypothetical protein
MYDGGFGGRMKLIPALTLSAVFTAACVWWGWGEIAKGDWPTVEGKRGRMVGETWTEDNLVLGDSGEHTTQLSYRYEVDGKSYSGQEGIGESETSRARFQRLTSRPTVTVRYDPSNPKSSWLDDGAPRSYVWIPWALGGLCFAVFLFGVGKFRRERWRA